MRSETCARTRLRICLAKRPTERLSKACDVVEKRGTVPNGLGLRATEKQL